MVLQQCFNFVEACSELLAGGAIEQRGNRIIVGL